MARRFGELILLVNSRTFPRLRFQLKGWLEEVDVETGRFVESTQCRGFTEAFQPAITNQLANNRPVLLFDPCLVVLSIGAAAGEDDALLLAIVPQRVVHECAVVVCIKTEQGKWESAPQTGNGFHNDGLLANRNGHALSPTRSHIRQHQRMHKGARSEEHTSELQSLRHLVCRLLLEKKK